MKSTYALSILIAFLSFSAGFKISLKTFEGKTTARLYEQGRIVAGMGPPVKKAFLFDDRITRRENIILSTTVVKDKQLGVIGFRFGNFITNGQSLCSAYNKIELVLFGDNIATSGKHPQLIFTGNCPSAASTDLESQELQLQDVFPLFLISNCENNTKVNNEYNLSNGTDIKVVNMDVGISEPDWVLESISFYNDDDNRLNSENFNFEQIQDILRTMDTRSDNPKIKFICQ